MSGKDSERLRNEMELSKDEAHVLDVLRKATKNGVSFTGREIQDRTGLSIRRISTARKSLMEKGLVERGENRVATKRTEPRQPGRNNRWIQGRGHDIYLNTVVRGHDA